MKSCLRLWRPRCRLRHRARAGTGRREEERVTTGGLSSKRLTRVRDVLGRHLDAGYILFCRPGLAKLVEASSPARRARAVARARSARFVPALTAEVRCVAGPSLPL